MHLYRPASSQRRRLSPAALPANDSADALVSKMVRVSSSLLLRRFLIFFLLLLLALSSFFLFREADSLRFVPHFSFSHFVSSSAFPYVFNSADIADFPPEDDENNLKKVLDAASMMDKTVILTTVNEAWAAPNSIIDLFLESFRIGEHTLWLLNHLVIVALDKGAFKHCLSVHTHCFALVTEGVDFHQEAYFMTPDYLKMMWRRIDFLHSVLVMGYNFIFTDVDIMWFRDPFPRFHKDVDFQTACDHFIGDSSNTMNTPNGGFNFVKSNNRTIGFYKFWYSARETYPGFHDQDVLNRIKFDPLVNDSGLIMRFLDTAYFGGLCEPSKDLNLVCTMHANCCVGLESKLHDLQIMIEDWKHYTMIPPTLRRSSTTMWRVPQNCSIPTSIYTD